MKADTKWLRRSAMVVLGACLVAGFTGCFHDDDDDDWIPNFWEISWTNDDSGQSPLTLPYTGENLFDIPAISETAGDYSITLTVTGYGAGSTVDIRIWDSSMNTMFDIMLTGTIHDEYTASGVYSGSKKDGSFVSGTWNVYEK